MFTRTQKHNVPERVNEEQLPPLTRVEQCENWKKHTALVVASNSLMQMDQKVSITTRDTNNIIQIKVLLDSGCTRSAISWLCVRTHTKLYRTAQTVYNADHTINKWVKNYVEVEMTVIDSKGTEHREMIEL